MPRIICTVDEETDKAIRALRDERGGVPLANIVRDALKEYLNKRGYQITASVEWGGYRQSDPEEQ